MLDSCIIIQINRYLLSVNCFFVRVRFRYCKKHGLPHHFLLSNGQCAVVSSRWVFSHHSLANNSCLCRKQWIIFKNKYILKLVCRKYMKFHFLKYKETYQNGNKIFVFNNFQDHSVNIHRTAGIALANFITNKFQIAGPRILDQHQS